MDLHVFLQRSGLNIAKEATEQAALCTVNQCTSDIECFIK